MKVQNTTITQQSLQIDDLSLGGLVLSDCDTGSRYSKDPTRILEKVISCWTIYLDKTRFHLLFRFLFYGTLASAFFLFAWSEIWKRKRRRRRRTDLDFLIICSSKSSKSNSIRVLPPLVDPIPTIPPLVATFSSESSKNWNYFFSVSFCLESDDRRYAQSKRTIKV